MSTATAPRAGIAPRKATAYRVTFARVVHSEWHKFRTLRSTWITLIGSSVAILGVGLTMGATYEAGGGDSDVDTVLMLLFGFQLAQLMIAVLGVLVTAGEYSTGMVRSSLTAVPTRTPVLWAKAAVFGVVTFVSTLVTVLLTFPLAQLFLTGSDKEMALTDPGVLGTLVAASAGLALLGLIALGLGAVLRSVPGGIGGFIGLVLIVPVILDMLPYTAVQDAVRYFPAKSLESLTMLHPTPDAYPSTGAALLALALWAVAALGAGSLLLKRRDV
ncbi:ABC transporter permease [Streptomyces sp. YC504]|uniref:ABC transporter permease n=1 Tax=Streptomyces mesophilus TaxID=1775132 RepID=A0A6G4XSR6_9ACTN|nr:ABC transporter permease [Streptomyces mesophilus]NGO79847.1 ABC transporter permease [Streptomyces mesophilus]